MFKVTDFPESAKKVIWTVSICVKLFCLRVEKRNFFPRLASQNFGVTAVHKFANVCRETNYRHEPRSVTQFGAHDKNVSFEVASKSRPKGGVFVSQNSLLVRCDLNPNEAKVQHGPYCRALGQIYEQYAIWSLNMMNCFFLDAQKSDSFLCCFSDFPRINCLFLISLVP